MCGVGTNGEGGGEALGFGSDGPGANKPGVIVLPHRVVLSLYDVRYETSYFS